jgi:hypothetical protein
MTANYVDGATRRRTVLVVVMNNRTDMARMTEEGWYRIPQRRAPRRIGADYLAFYQTAAFKGLPEAQTITYIAPTRRYCLVTRRALLPDEADHPRADDYYFRIEIGPPERLTCPVVATSYRRFAFIHTTMERLLTAADVRDLYLTYDPFDHLWLTLREQRLRPLANRLVDQRPVDIALRARGGMVGIRCAADDSTQEAPIPFGTTSDSSPCWELLTLSTHQIEGDLDGCLRRIGAALLRLGGSTQ